MMKKLTLIVLFLSAITIYASNPGPKIGFKIEFGKPSLGCKKFGICTFQLIIDLDELLKGIITNVDENSGFGYPNVSEEGTLSLKLLKSTMTAETMKKHFNKGKFVVEEDYVFSTSVIKALNLPAGYKIKKGIYSYTESESEILLIL